MPLLQREKARYLSGQEKPGGGEHVDYKTIPSKMKMEYLHGIGDLSQRRLDGLQTLLAHLRKPKMNIDELLQEAANMISKQFAIDNVSIGLRDHKDGLYRYRAMVGFREDAIEAHKKIAYRKEQFYADSQFVGNDISKLSRLYLAEDNLITGDEEKAFNRPALLSMKRRTASESLEGDYIDTKIHGFYDELLGWIEISGTRTMQLPDSTTIRWIETVASIIGAALILQKAREG